MTPGLALHAVHLIDNFTALSYSFYLLPVLPMTTGIALRIKHTFLVAIVLLVILGGRFSSISLNPL